MADQWMRCNLASAIFPFAVQLWGRSIIVPQYDQNFDKTINVAVATADSDRDKGIPQAFYMHNCMPTPQGYQAIGYDVVITALLGATDFDIAFPLITPDLARFIFVPASGKNYVYDAVVGGWASVSPFPPGTVPDTVMVTTAFIQGQTYIYYGKFGCYIYDDVTQTMVPVVLVGLTATDVFGITEANGYMIAWNATSVAWSSLATPTDFTPSLITGAGGGSISDAVGRIVCCLPISGGFMVYCEKNVVSAKYSGNVKFPFIFKEVNGSGGIAGTEQVSWTSNLAEHYAWTTQGFQKLDMQAAVFVTPELTDFLGNLFYEDFDESTLLLTTTYLASQLRIKVTVVSDRYLVVSYGVSLPDYTYALVYDIALKRWGKLKLTHRDCFQYNYPSLYGAVTYGMLIGTTYGALSGTTYGDLLNIQPLTPDIAKKTIAFLQGDGTIQTVNFDQAQLNANGVLILGKFQFHRNYFITHQGTDVENVQPTGTFEFYILPSLDGKSFLTPVLGFLSYLSQLSRKYLGRVSGQSISLLFKGNFNLTSILLLFTPGGKR